MIQRLYTALICRQLGSYGKNSLFITFSKFFIPHNIHIGNNVFINQQCILVAEEKITIGDNVSIGFRAMIITSNNELHIDKNMRKRIHFNSPVIIENDVWIASGAIILPGVTIGEGSVVGAGAVVTKNVPKFTLVGEVPARIIKTIEPTDTFQTLRKYMHVRAPAPQSTTSLVH